MSMLVEVADGLVIARKKRAKCANNDDVMKIIITITMTMTTPTITTTAMMITTMAMAMPLFFLSQHRWSPKSSPPKGAHWTFDL